MKRQPRLSKLTIATDICKLIKTNRKNKKTGKLSRIEMFRILGYISVQRNLIDELQSKITELGTPRRKRDRQSGSKTV